MQHDTGPAEPLVSVIIPTRHRLALLRRAIASVDAQTYQNIEIIVVDNFADAPLTLDDISSRWPLSIVRTDHMSPLPVSRNFGAAHANGAFLCFLDDDDSYRPVKIREEADALIADSSLDFVYGDTEQIGDDGATIMVSSGPPDIIRFLHWRYIHTNALMIRKRVFERVKYNPDMTTYEDVEFMGRLLRDYKGVRIPRIHAVWNRDNRPDQMTRRNWSRAYRNWRRLCLRFDPEIMADADLRRFYHRKMFVLSVMFADVRQALVSGPRML